MDWQYLWAETKKLRGEDSLLLAVRWLCSHRSGTLRTANLRTLCFSTPR